MNTPHLELVTSSSTLEVRRQQLFDFLAEEGFRPSFSETEPGRLVFKCEGLPLLLQIEEADRSFYQMVCAGFWPFDDEAERKRALVAANEVNSSAKLVKLFTGEKGMIASVEMLCADFDQFRQIFDRAQRIMTNGLARFRDEMNRLKAN